MSVDKKGLKSTEKKWTKALMDAGWAVFPSAILENQQRLGLDAVDVNILMHLTARWSKAEGKAFPSKGAIALAMGLDPRTVQRRIARLEADGYVRREERRDTPTGSQPNIYHLDGLIAATRPFAQEKLADKAAKAEAKAARKAAKSKSKPAADGEG
jgi:DNA-binding transcriptional regulator YhcF (GntR family)